MSVAPKELSELYHARLPGVLVVIMVAAQLNDSRNKSPELLQATATPQRVEQ